MTTPGRLQYLRLKEKHPDAVLLYRMGDFYEMFDEDAHIAARALGITLTSRSFGRGGRVPMAGIPYHALNGYLRRFLRAGHRLAICEQLSAPGNGLVDRDVVRVLSPGTIDDPALLDAQRPNYLLAIAELGALFGLAWVDVSTGASEYRVMPSDETASVAAFIDQLAPAEIVGPVDDDLGVLEQASIRPVDGDWTVDEAQRHYEARFPNAEPVRPAALRAIGVMLGYLQRGHAALLASLEQPLAWVSEGVMILDRQTRVNLEIDLRSRDRRDLFALLNETQTAPGARRLHAFLDRPLTDRATLERRLDAVTELHDAAPLRGKLVRLLGTILDLERLATRIATGAIRARELSSLAETLGRAGELRALLAGQVRAPLLRELVAEIDALPEAQAAIRNSLDEESARLLQRGTNPRLDRLYTAMDDERAFIASLEKTERERSGIRGLKVGYNKVAGYYIEISRANRLALPDHFVRKQTLTNAERYITPELKEAENRILGAEEQVEQLESELYAALIRNLSGYVSRMRATAGALATIDVLNALATVASEQRWTRPQLADDTDLTIVAGRHPVVERELPHGEFMPNDAHLTDDAGRVVILTGPNMAGKSTYLRQVALTVLLAQVGSFVPAQSACIGLVDRIFTRIGAHDDLARGQSTFMVEMLETATILNHATDRSLVVLDEIGRGTSTEDGVAIAGAVVEHLVRQIGARTLFATHFRELSTLAHELPGLRAMQTAVERRNDRLLFLHAIVPGVAEAAFGLDIARLAGLPDVVIERARASVPIPLHAAPAPTMSVAVINEQPVRYLPDGLGLAREQVANDLLALDLANTTPLEALNALAAWQSRLRSATHDFIGPRSLNADTRHTIAQAD